MLNLTDHLRRLRVDKYEYVAMKVIVLLQSGEYILAAICKFDILSSTCILFANRHIRFTRTGEGACVPRESIASITIIYSASVSRCAIQIWWAPIADTGTTANVSSKSFIHCVSTDIWSNWFPFWHSRIAGGQRNADDQIKGWSRIQFADGITTWRTLTVTTTHFFLCSPF